MGAVLDRMVRLSYYDNVIQKTDKVPITPQPSAHVCHCTHHASAEPFAHTELCRTL